MPGVYTSYERYKLQVKGFSGAVAKKFKDEKAAENFVAAGADYGDQVRSRALLQRALSPLVPTTATRCAL